QSIKGRKKSSTPAPPRVRPQPRKRAVPVRSVAKRPISPSIPRIVVQPSGGPLALRNAIAKAKPGSQIVLSSGKYAEPLVIDKSIELISASSESDSKVIIESTGAPCVLVKNGRVSIRGIYFERNMDLKKTPSPPAAA